MEHNPRYVYNRMKGMKIEYPFYLLLITGYILMIGIGCKKEKAILPEVNTTEVTIVTPVSASCSGIVISAGSSKLIDKGLCWSRSISPTIKDSTVSAYLYPYLISFELRISGLTANATYYVRAYATSEAGTSYGNELSFSTPSDLTGEKGTVTDVDGNVYQTTGIGSQFWIAENLKTTKFNDGTSIPLVTDNTAWSLLFTPAYCWYNNDELSNKSTYGALYNWYTVNTGKLCPSGWHVPNNSEWAVLALYLGGSEVAGGRMKIPGTEYWKSPNAGATNSSEFSAFPSGLRWSNGFEFLGEGCAFWSSTIDISNSAWSYGISNITMSLDDGTNTIINGYSIRCARD